MREELQQQIEASDPDTIAQTIHNLYQAVGSALESIDSVESAGPKAAAAAFASMQMTRAEKSFPALADAS